MELLGPFVRALLWGVPPLLFFTAFRRYLQAQDIVRPITFAVVSANLINFAGNWLLMYGHWGAPRMGLEGSGISTPSSRVYIALVLLIAVLRHERMQPATRSSTWSGVRDLARIRRLIALGLPSAMQILFEGAVFAVVTVLAARFDEVSLAAHSIAVNVISITFMVPLGISSAAAVRVGQAVGRKDPRGIAVAGWTALLLGALFMGAAGLGSHLAPRWIARLYTPEAAVIAASVDPAAHRRPLRNLRRPPGRRHRRPARTRRHPHSRPRPPGRLLDLRHARRLRALLPLWLGCHRHLGRPDRGSHCGGRDSARRVVPRNEGGVTRTEGRFSLVRQ